MHAAMLVSIRFSCHNGALTVHREGAPRRVREASVYRRLARGASPLVAPFDAPVPLDTPSASPRAPIVLSSSLQISNAPFPSRLHPRDACGARA